MVQGWVTTLVLAFGIGVAIIGVIAYLRMFRKDRLSSTSNQSADVSPPNVIRITTARDSEHNQPPKSEKTAPRD
jgi:hypothetical protein